MRTRSPSLLSTVAQFAGASTSSKNSSAIPSPVGIASTRPRSLATRYAEQASTLSFRLAITRACDQARTILRKLQILLAGAMTPRYDHTTILKIENMHIDILAYNREEWAVSAESEFANGRSRSDKFADNFAGGPIQKKDA